MIDESQIAEIARAIEERLHPRRILLFGSQARGDSHAASNLNLCIIVPSAGEWLERQVEFRKAVDFPAVEIEPHIFTAEEFDRLRGEGNPFVLQILEEGRVLYEQQ